MTKNIARARQLSLLAASAALVNPRAVLTGDAAIAQLADDMRYAVTRLGNVTQDDMSLLGWSRTQLATYEIAARERAYKLEAAH